jgi:hypothetical protein
MQQFLKLLPGLGIAVLSGLYDYLVAQPPGGVILLKTLLIVAGTRALGWLVKTYGPQFSVIVLLAVLAPACKPASADERRAVDLPDAPGPVVVGKKGKIAAGDTLVYTVSWGPGARATSYDVRYTVAATNGAWAVVADSNGSGKWTTGNGVGGLPTLSNVTLTTLKTWMAAIPWDSASFTVSVTSRNASGVSTPVSTTWKVQRKPGLPGPIVIDSSAVIGAAIIPAALTLNLASADTLCAVKLYQSGHAALKTVDAGPCAAAYATLPASMRAVTAWEQAHEDSACWSWSSSAPTKVPVSPLGTCRASSRIDGLQITSRTSRELLRYVHTVGPIATIDPRTGVVYCWRPGAMWHHALVVRDSVERARQVPVVRDSVLITCREPSALPSASIAARP